MYIRKNILLAVFGLSLSSSIAAGESYYEPEPFGSDSQWARDSDNVAIGDWWKPVPEESQREKEMRDWLRSIPREEAVAFALYTHDHGVLKLTAQCFPLLPEEPKMAVLEFKREHGWEVAQEQPVQYPGWYLHFRVEGWSGTEDVPFRVRLGELSAFEGLVRRDPAEKDTIVVANMSCNSPRDSDRYRRAQLVDNLKRHDPDLLFFAGDQNYTHDEATYGWLQFGVQFREVMKNRPTICIPDDHDVGHGNLWGESGKVSTRSDGADGGFMFPPSFVNMVQRQQTWNLPDPYDARPVQQGIGVYYTDLNWGGISFAILEDRKFKSAPYGNIPEMGPRPDHINDPAYDRSSIDLPGLQLLGERQLEFLRHWVRDWEGAAMKVALSQTAFCGAVHLHGSKQNRLLADLDSNAWPQAGRNEALRLLRSAQAFHLCGDQHLSVVVKHGIEAFRDGPFAFTSPALVNTIYGRWWWPEDEAPGGGEAIDSALPWVGDYEDGLGNKITMLAYANPTQGSAEELRKESSRMHRGDGYGLIRFEKSTGKTIFEAWPRFADLSEGDAAQFPGWPVEVQVSENDGRRVVGYLEKVTLPFSEAVVELWNEDTGELVYCRRVKGNSFEAPVFANAKHTLKAGLDRAEIVLLSSEIPRFD
ncbi:hypothetical protein QEH56_16140 [Pelagicoccus enzymogenes]|uniref:hypothetical protein n=1 Tax=Pelagicoccus enzymogenes TaxID=2773457 RepID=UPI00280C4594|nr:hypothetical protein [Pelagicoccus enzymogenes]MDQ8199693.1 hypothetical protein [Pelagicoccus enzymogenes]